MSSGHIQLDLFENPPNLQIEKLSLRFWGMQMLQTTVRKHPGLSPVFQTEGQGRGSVLVSLMCHPVTVPLWVMIPTLPLVFRAVTLTSPHSTHISIPTCLACWLSMFWSGHPLLEGRDSMDSDGHHDHPYIWNTISNRSTFTNK